MNRHVLVGRVALLLVSLQASSPLRAQQPPEPAAETVRVPAPTPAPRPAPAPDDAPPTPAADPSAALAAANARVAALEERVAHLEQARGDAALTELDTTELARPALFRVYGFADFGINHAWIGRQSFVHGLAPRDTTFTLGNLNLYFDFQPGPEWQVLTELRVTTYPHGVEETYATPLGGTYQRTNTTVLDVASPATASTLRWGGLVLERAYAQWSHSELLNVRVGQFLTPYGIWNVDHGTPTLIALMLPHFVAAEAFPARQVGVEVHGRALHAAWEYGYSAYVSNGRTATSVDFTEDKALGARLRLARHDPLPIAIGASAYYGQIDDVAKRIDSFAPFHVASDLIVEGHEVGLGLDLSIDIDSLRIRTEGITHFVRYEDGKRAPVTFGSPDTFRPDYNEYDGYLLLAYRLPWLGLEPFAYGELNRAVTRYGDLQAMASLGLNIHFTPFAQLKTQLSRALFFNLDDGRDFSRHNMTLLYSRLAVAF